MIGIINYGMGNITSVKNAFSSVGKEVKVVDSPHEVLQLSHIVIPGVGAFKEAMLNLEKRGLIDIIKERAKMGIHILGICLGMQILATSGEEGGFCEGLDLIPGEVKGFPFNNPRVPHVGWDDIRIIKENPILTDEHDLDFYFVHSYYFVPKTKEAEIAVCDYGIDFSAAVQQDNIFGVQFHPEKSFKAGLSLLKNFSDLK